MISLDHEAIAATVDRHTAREINALRGDIRHVADLIEDQVVPGMSHFGDELADLKVFVRDKVWPALVTDQQRLDAYERAAAAGPPALPVELAPRPRGRRWWFPWRAVVVAIASISLALGGVAAFAFAISRT